MAVRFFKAGTQARVFHQGRFRHAIVVSVTSQDELVVRIGRSAPVTVTRIPGTSRFTSEVE
jgi:hypothetical protein